MLSARSFITLEVTRFIHMISKIKIFQILAALAFASAAITYGYKATWLKQTDAVEKLWNQYWVGKPSKTPYTNARALDDWLGNECELKPTKDWNELYRSLTTPECHYISKHNAIIMSQFFKGPYGDVPYHIIAPKDSATINTIVIYLHGGPIWYLYTANENSGIVKFQTQLVDEGYAFIHPLYVGSLHRSVYPHYSDINFAIAEVDQLIRGLRKRFPEKRLIIHGDSAGGYIAYKLKELEKSDGIVLESPLLTSPQNLIKTFTNQARTAREKHIFKNEQVITQFYDFTDGVLILREPGIANKLKLFMNFFEEYSDKYLIENINDSIIKKTTIIYGDRDDRIGIGEIKNIKNKYKDLFLIKIPNMGHYIENKKNLDDSNNAVILTYKNIKHPN